MAQLNEFLAQAQQLDEGAFVATFPEPVLVGQMVSEGTDPRNEYRSTLRLQLDKEKGEVRIHTAPPGPSSPVLVIRKTDRNSISGRIIVGRTETNDLVVTHLTVSKHHAYFRLEPEGGRVQLADTGSTNGTRLNGRSLTAGVLYDLRDGDQIFFGDVGFDFYTASGFYNLLRSISILR
jgi:pSer/pThr/pTyr-binding forkhead associated (FHA) protein